MKEDARKNCRRRNLQKRRLAMKKYVAEKKPTVHEKPGTESAGRISPKPPPIVLARARRVEATYCSSFILPPSSLSFIGWSDAPARSFISAGRPE